MPPLKIGFDLDGVLLYNPARILRPISMGVKKLLPKKKSADRIHFYYPKSPIEQFVWHVVHWSSLFVAEGFEDIKKLSKNRKIEAYIVTSRYDCLKSDFDRWLRTLNKEQTFIKTFHNEKNLQPHVFKAEKINELSLDYFVEDNWDIVRYINAKTKTPTVWISNAFDREIPYDLKFFTLQDAVNFIKTKTDST
ncbi:hypothetical protein BH09PAT2_BH09PAT2_08370 [soil metagenome]